jgi:hypothetical protein
LFYSNIFNLDGHYTAGLAITPFEPSPFQAFSKSNLSLVTKLEPSCGCYDYITCHVIEDEDAPSSPLLHALKFHPGLEKQLLWVQCLVVGEDPYEYNFNFREALEHLGLADEWEELCYKRTKSTK